MRQMFLGFVLVGYVALAPTGRPAVDLFDNDTIALSERANEIRRAWTSGEYGGLLLMCRPEQRNEAIRSLVEIAGNGEPDAHGHAAELTPEATRQLIGYKARLKQLIETERLSPTGDELRLHRANQSALYTEVFRWLRETGRVTASMHRIFTGAPRIRAFDGDRGNVQFCAADGHESAVDPVLMFERVRGRWMHPLDFK